MWETIPDLNVHVQVAKASIFFRRYTLLKILPKIGTGLIFSAPTGCVQARFLLSKFDRAKRKNNFGNVIGQQ